MHRIDSWERNRPTDLPNGVPLCDHDHHLPHEYGYTIQRDPETGAVHWWNAAGVYLGSKSPRVPPKPIPTKRTRPKRRKLPPNIERDDDAA